MKLVAGKEFEAMIEFCNNIAKETGQKAFSKAMKVGAERVLERARSNLLTRTKSYTGRLAGALRIKGNKKYEPHTFIKSIGVALGRKRDDLNGAYYAHMVEFGHEIVSKNHKTKGKRTEPIPFLSNALLESEQQVTNTIRIEVGSFIEKSFKKLGKKAPESVTGLEAFFNSDGTE